MKNLEELVNELTGSMTIDKIDDADPLILANTVLQATSDWKSHPKLTRLLSQQLYNESMSLMKAFLDLCLENNITFIMADGILLGSYFFHDIIL